MARSFKGLKNQQAIRQEMADFRRGPLMPKYRQVVYFLYRHAGKKYKSAILRNLFDIKPRDLFYITEHARRCQHMLCSGSGGYWMETDPIKVMECMLSLRSRAMTQLETCSFLGKAATRKQHHSLFGRLQRAETKQLEP